MYEYQIFEDSVHGHIKIPKIYCQKIIDTRIFQRLRRIEQTSMRPIFPSAHHDRFIHSLGVYHVGENLFSHIQENTEKYDSTVYSFIEGKIGQFIPTPFIQKDEKNDGYWSGLKRTYHLACLLHDCGHAPFSHTLEKYYYNEYLAGNGDKLTIPLNADIIKEYENCINENKDLGESDKNKIIDDFKRDLAQCNPKPHELVSSWLVLHEQGFRNIIKGFDADPLLIARMIIGCKFKDSTNPKEDSTSESEQVLNCFISILNGHEIDADRLDYAIRDTWATGLNTVKINLNRIFSSIYITNKNSKSENSTKSQYVICFRRKGVSELQNLLDIKNFTSFWIFNHHKIKYNEDVLVKAVKKLALLLNVENATENDVTNYISIKNNDSLDSEHKKAAIDALENNAMYRLFDYKNFIEHKDFVVRIDDKSYCDTLFLMSDDDIVHLLKKYFCVKRDYTDNTISSFFENALYANEWFSREQHLVPLWKSYAEYNVRYFNPFLLEIEAIKEFKNAIGNISSPERKNIDKYKEILVSNKTVHELLLKIKKHKEKAAINIIIDNYSDSEDLFEKMESSLKEAERYYLEVVSYDRILEDIAIDIIKEIKKEGFKIKPEAETPKIMHIEKLNIKEIKANSIYVEINDEIVCYTELNLPLKNQEKIYNFFYIFMPRIFNSEGKTELKNKNKEYSEKLRTKFLEKQYEFPKA
jgi:HD superfamily phosphohydrolase